LILKGGRPVKALTEKLNSRRGASILLALLFLLVAMLVAASVLMAAVSNAGKVRSNYDEQQKYFALSSALRVVADQIEEAQYTVNYEVYTWTVSVEVGETENEKGETVPVYEDRHYYQIGQLGGTFKCGKLTGLAIKVLDFTKELDGVYAKEFTKEGYIPYGNVVNISPYDKRTLTVTVDTDGMPDNFEGKFPAVTVEVEMKANMDIHLTATLTDGEDTDTGKKAKIYTMEAELSAVKEMFSFPSVSGTKGYNKGNPAGTTPVSESRKTPDKPDVTWKLDWISKEVTSE